MKTKFPKLIKVSVTKTNIKNAANARISINYNKSCPIALALKDLGYKNPSVYTEGVYFNGLAYHLPLNAIVFVKKFDEGIPVKPFQFTLIKAKAA